MAELNYTERQLKLSDELGEIEKLITEMEVGISFVSPPKEMIVATKSELRYFLDKHSLAIKKFAIVENELDFTIHRLTDRFDLASFYETDIMKDVVNETAIDTLKRICKKFLDSDVSVIKKIAPIVTEHMKNDRAIPYTYLQRYTSTNKAFKNSKIGATDTLKFAIDSLITEGYMKKMELRITRHLYDTGSSLYQIINK